MTNEAIAERGPAGQKRGLKAMLLLPWLVALLIVPVLFWGEIVFGRSLDLPGIRVRLEAALDKDRALDPRVLREAEHAVEQLEQKRGEVQKKDRELFALLGRLGEHPSPVLRRAAAWCMGRAVSYAPFGDTLASMLGDEDPLTRQNAALGLGARKDPRARQALQRMLKGQRILAPTKGRVLAMIASGPEFEAGAKLLFLDQPNGGRRPVHASTSGSVGKRFVEPGANVEKGTPVLLLQPSRALVLEILRSLRELGKKEDAKPLRESVEALGYKDRRIDAALAALLKELEARG